MSDDKAPSSLAVMRSVAVLLMAILACNIPQPLTSPSIGSETPLPVHTSTPAPTPVPSNLVWFAPNMGSGDYAELFSKPENWSIARDKIDIFEFYTQNLLDDPCQICGDNILHTFVDVHAFEKLRSWQIAIAVEVGAVKEWGCTGDEEFRVADLVVRNVQTHAGEVDFLSMDEPFIGGELVTNGKGCGYTMEQSAAAAARFIGLVHSKYPQIVIGDIEPYPYFSEPKLEQWITTLENQAVRPAFFHLDVDVERVRVEGQNVGADLQALDKFCRDHGIPFGVIFTSNWKAAGSNRAYFDSSMEWIHTVKEAIGKPEHVIFQSWQGPAPSGAHEIPINLPQNDPANYSHIRLINEGLDLLNQ